MAASRAKRPLERDFKKLVKKDLNTMGAYFFVKEEAAIRGLPDIVGWFHGVGFAFELKRDIKEAKKTTGRIKLQRHVIDHINRQQCFARISCPETWEGDKKALLKLACSKRDGS